MTKLEMTEYLEAHGMTMSGDDISGYQIISRKGHPLTLVSSIDEIQREVKDNGLAIRIAGQVTPPSSETISRYLESLDETVARLEAAEAEYRPIVERLKSSTSDDPEDISSVVRGAVARAFANIPRHLAMVERARRTAAEAPSRLVLPLGTKVRLKNAWNVPEYCALDPSIAWARVFRPAAGSVGVVSGNCFGSQEASIAISFPDKVKTTNGMAGEHFEPHLALNRSVLVSDLEVLEYATYVDGMTCYSPDVVPTHAVVYEEDDVADVMILDLDGRVMAVYADGTPFDEGVHFHTSPDDIEHLVPINEHRHPAIAP